MTVSRRIQEYIEQNGLSGRPLQGALEQLLEADIDHELILGALNIIQKEKLESDKLFVILENFVVSHEDIGVQEKALEVLLISA